MAQDALTFVSQLGNGFTMLQAGLQKAHSPHWVLGYLTKSSVEIIAADLLFLLGQDYYTSISSNLNISSHS